jgi:hypothetical protein
MKAAAYSKDPKLVAEAMKSLPRAKNLNSRSFILEGFEIFGSTKKKLDFPPCSKFY